MNEPRAYTADEIRDQLIDSIWASIKMWAGPLQDEHTIEERLSGLAHSILVALDGCSADLPAFMLVTDTTAEDQEFRRSEGENWYLAGMAITDMLHEHLYRDDLRRDR